MMLLFASQLDDYKGVYDSSASYKKGNVVTDNGSFYLCLQDNKGIPTSQTLYWAFLSNILLNQLQTLSDANDVDMMTVPPVNDDVLTFESGKWMPKALPNKEGTVTFESWIIESNETVELINDVPPEDVSNVRISYLDKNGFILNWTESPTPDTKDYVLYNDTTLIAEVPATISKLQPIAYQVSDLLPATNYTFTIKARDHSNNVSRGVTIPVRTYGLYSILMNGKTDYIKLPVISFDTIELTCKASPGPEGDWYIFIDARPGVSSAYFAINDNGNVQYGLVWTKIQVNGVNPIDINSVRNNKMTLTLGLSSSASGEINIFSNYKNTPAMMGNIYSIIVLNKGNIAASYNLTEKFDGNSITDISGNGKTASLFGGTWVTDLV